MGDYCCFIANRNKNETQESKYTGFYINVFSNVIWKINLVILKIACFSINIKILNKNVINLFLCIYNSISIHGKPFWLCKLIRFNNI